MIPLYREPNGAVSLRFGAKAGYYQISIIADGKDFDWEGLYLSLHCYGNTGQRTGPWDFNLLDSNKPLLPSYWVFIDGVKIGLWNFERISLEDLSNRYFRGRMAFRLQTPGVHELKLVPYRDFKAAWRSFRIEPDPETPRHFVLPFSGNGSPHIDWTRLREQLATTHAPFASILQEALDWVVERPRHYAAHLPLLIAAHFLRNRAGALEKALAEIDRLVALPSWGNPCEEGYGHNGDLEASLTLRTLAWCWHILADELGAKRREELAAKLALQGERFIDQALLSREYWGGSLVQDHGWRSMLRFGAAALLLRGVIPGAKAWLQWAVPRIEKAFAATSTDGVIPLSSYGNLDLYLNDLAVYYDAYVTAGGPCFYSTYPFPKVADYLLVMARGGHDRFIDGGVQTTWIAGGMAFFNQLASRFRCTKAAYLSHWLASRPTPPFHLESARSEYYLGVFHAALNYDPSVPAKAPESQPPGLVFFEDSGLAHYVDPVTDLTLAVRCGPLFGRNAYRKAQGSSDRLGSVPGAGHFTVFLGSKARLITPEPGYRMHSFQRSCLLIDNEGQTGDIGYPMSLPSHPDQGDEVERVEWCEETGEGFIRLKLADTYPKHLGVVSYYRELILKRGHATLCRDTVLLKEPRTLSWLFQFDLRDEVELNGCEAVIAKDFTIRAEPLCFNLNASLHQTEIVWSYSSPSFRAPVGHVRFDSPPVCFATVDFRFGPVGSVSRKEGQPGPIGPGFP